MGPVGGRARAPNCDRPAGQPKPGASWDHTSMQRTVHFVYDPSVNQSISLPSRLRPCHHRASSIVSNAPSKFRGSFVNYSFGGEVPSNNRCSVCNLGYPTEHVGGLALLFKMKYMYVFSRNRQRHLSHSQVRMKAAHTKVSSLKKYMCMLRLLNTH